MKDIRRMMSDVSKLTMFLEIKAYTGSMNETHASWLRQLTHIPH